MSAPFCHVCLKNDTGFFGKKNGHSLYACNDCGLMFVYPIPASTNELYAKEYFSGASHGYGYISYDEDKEPMRHVFLKYIELIKSYVKEGSKLLDVGAATGFFVRLAVDAGFVAEGIEISDHAASLGRAKGLNIRTGVLADVDGMFDCITMLDVIEHVPDPRAEITKAAALLRSGGILVINTPDAGSLFARVMGSKWHLIIPPEHLYHFNLENLERLLNEAGIYTELETTIGKSYTLKYAFKMVYKWTKLRIFDAVASFFSRDSFSRLAVPINFHDNMLIIARKK